MQRHEDIVLNQIGTPIPGVTITVRVQNATPGSGALATIYSDDGTTIISGSAVTTDTNGRFFFFAPDGKYDLTATGTGITTYTLADIEIADVTERFSLDSPWVIDTQTVGLWNNVRIVDGLKFLTIQAAIDDLPARGGIVYIPPGTYDFTSTLTLGDGDGTQVSTTNNIILIGASSSSGFQTPTNSGVTIRWTGSAGGTLCQVKGTITGVKMNGIYFDGNSLAATGFEITSSIVGKYSDIHVQNCTGDHLIIDTVTADNGGTLHCERNIFENVTVKSNANAGTTSIRMNGNISPATGVFGNIFIGGFAQYDNVSGRALVLQKADSNTWFNWNTIDVGAGSNDGILLDNAVGGGTFPDNNFFFGCSIQQGVAQTGSPQRNWFFLYMTDDGETIPQISGAKGMTQTGRWFGTDLDLDNNKQVVGLETGGTRRGLVSVNTSNVVVMGASAIPTLIQGTRTEIDGDLDHDGSNVGFYGTTPVAQQTGVAVTEAAIHAALVNLGLITA